MFVSENPVERAEAYEMIGRYHGFDNLDSYPGTLKRREAETRYREV
jgi:hypothetical protein